MNAIKITGILSLLIVVVCSFPAQGADQSKVLRIAIPAEEGGFDPARNVDLFSASFIEVLFERLLTYDYLARPAKLIPMLAEAMPEVRDKGRTYIFKIRKGVFYIPDPAFKGAKRELIAEDFVYALKRLADPKNRSPLGYLVVEKFEGLDELIAQAKKTGHFDYDAEVEGLQALDSHTLQFKLKKTNYNFLYECAHMGMSPIAREVAEKYGNELSSHPVGTGPYLIKAWTPQSKIVLEANPDYRGFTWNFKSSDPNDKDLIGKMTGKQMPQIGRVEISVINEGQSEWLAFNQKQLDYISVPLMFSPRVFDSRNQLRSEWKNQGVTVDQSILPSVTFTAFNFRDPIVGGYTKDKIALRRAIIMAYNVEEEIRVLLQGQAVEAQMIVPEGVAGYNPKYRKINKFNPPLANDLLDYFGYKKGADGYRTLPDGRPLILRFGSGTGSGARVMREMWIRSMNRIGIRIDFDIAMFAELFERSKSCKLMMGRTTWVADFPDGENFAQILYGPNTGKTNFGCYESKAYDALYEKAQKLPDSPERDALFSEMTRQVEFDGAWSLHVSAKNPQIIWPRVQGFKKHPILQAEFLYLDIDKTK